MHLVGFIIEIYYDARPYERQILRCMFLHIFTRKEISLFKL